MSEVHCGGKKSSKAAAEKFESKEANYEEAGGDVNQMASVRGLKTSRGFLLINVPVIMMQSEKDIIPTVMPSQAPCCCMLLVSGGHGCVALSSSRPPRACANK